MSMEQVTDPGSVGLVAPCDLVCFQPPNRLRLECGAQLGPITIRYETYGTLSPARDNAILICHALSGSAHAAGRHAAEDKKPGWWDIMIGPGKAFDTDRYFVICPNFLGSCYGTTGPSSVNPETGRPWGISFPMITVKDMVNAQAALIDHLGIERLLCVTGGSLGGMQTLEWATAHPERVRSAIPIATTHRLSPQAIAFDEVGRQAIMSDPNWNQGDYYGRQTPNLGLALARMIAHITYLSEASMMEKFGRRLQDKDAFGWRFDSYDFAVESYLHYQGLQFVGRFDANAYLYISKAMDYFDLSVGFASLRESVERATCRFLIMSYSSDWLFPPSQSRELERALRYNHADVTSCEISSDYGHDAFLLEHESMTHMISPFLEHTLAGAH